MLLLTGYILLITLIYFVFVFSSPGVLLYGAPGTGKTLLARACAAQTKSTFLKLAGPQLVQMFIGDGAKLVRDAFALAKEKQPAIIFIDELDAIGEAWTQNVWMKGKIEVNSLSKTRSRVLTIKFELSPLSNC